MTIVERVYLYGRVLWYRFQISAQASLKEVKACSSKWPYLRHQQTPTSLRAGAIASAVVLHHEHGPLFDRVRIERPGSYWPETIVSLPRNLPRIDLSETLDRAKMPFVPYKEPAARYSFGFYFSAANGSQRLVSNGEELYRFPEDLLPGARQDAVVPRHTLVWSTGNASHPYQLMLAQQQSFFDELPLKPCPPDSPDCPPGLRVVVMLKSDQAETRDEGVVSSPSARPMSWSRFSSQALMGALAT